MVSDQQHGPETARQHWTADQQGRSNSSAAFRGAVDAVNRLFRGGAGGAVLRESWTSGTAALIVAQLAHVHHFAPASAGPLSASPVLERALQGRELFAETVTAAQSYDRTFRLAGKGSVIVPDEQAARLVEGALLHLRKAATS